VSDATPLTSPWKLTPEAFNKFLFNLAPDRTLAGERYEVIRHKLIRFFEWRDCPHPDEHADETLNRVIRKIDQGGELENPSTYVYGVARMLLLEISKEKEREKNALQEVALAQPSVPDETDDSRAVCLQRCLEALPAESRDLIIEYYQGEGQSKIENRKQLAERCSLPLNALRIRALRVREKLEVCVKSCVERI
jgi:DNA-directed RNA polymerase specialized sigma24 family protein